MFELPLGNLMKTVYDQDAEHLKPEENYVMTLSKNSGNNLTDLQPMKTKHGLL